MITLALEITVFVWCVIVIKHIVVKWFKKDKD